MKVLDYVFYCFLVFSPFGFKVHSFDCVSLTSDLLTVLMWLDCA